MQEREDVGPIHWLVELIDQFVAIEVFNGVVFYLIVLLTTLAGLQVIVFDLEKFRGVYKKNKPGTKWLVNKDPVHPGFKVVAYLGMGSAFYGLFIAHVHLSVGSWIGLVALIIGIVALVSFVQRAKKDPPPKKKLNPGAVVSWDPDIKLSWCMTCKAHTRVLKSGDLQGSCANCRGTIYSLFVPVHTRNAGCGCAGCAAVPAVIGLASLLGWFGPEYILGGAALGGFGFLIVVGFPGFFFYQYFLWRSWSRNAKEMIAEETGEEMASETASAIDRKK